MSAYSAAGEVFIAAAIIRASRYKDGIVQTA